MAKIRAVCFDAFGTVVEITDKRGPFHKMLNNDYDAFAVRALTQPLGLRDLAKQLKNPPDEDTIVGWEADFAAECASIRQRPSMKSIWATLQRAQLQIGVCSNLALPYAKPMLGALPAQPASLVLSYRVGTMKPHKKIYQLVASQLELRLSEILFVGNHLEGDVWGPAAAGAHAMTIREFETSFSSWPSIYAPRQITDLFGRISVAKKALNSPAPA